MTLCIYGIVKFNIPLFQMQLKESNSLQNLNENSAVNSTNSEDQNAGSSSTSSGGDGQGQFVSVVQVEAGSAISVVKVEPPPSSNGLDENATQPDPNTKPNNNPGECSLPIIHLLSAAFPSYISVECTLSILCHC